MDSLERSRASYAIRANPKIYDNENNTVAAHGRNFVCLKENELSLLNKAAEE
jgi:hypothetical protein